MTFLARTNNPEIDERIAAKRALRPANLRRGEGITFREVSSYEDEASNISNIKRCTLHKSESEITVRS